MDDRIRLIYVASTGRSGSTLLEMLLGAQEGVATVGEIHLWTHELTRDGVIRQCGCGLQTVDCPFWQAVRRQVDPLTQPTPRIDHFREAHDGGRTLRLGKLPSFVSGRHPVDGAAIAAYADNNEAAFRAIADVTRSMTGTAPTWLVDASKDPYRLLWLVASGRFDIQVLHVTKVPPSFVWSEGKPVWRDTGAGAGARIHNLARNVGVWSVINTLTLAAARQLPPDHYLHVPYEQLAAEPEATMRAISRSVGFDFDPASLHDFRQRQFHAMAGNAMRQDTRPIVFEEVWRTRLPRWARWAAPALGAPVSELLAHAPRPVASP